MTGKMWTIGLIGLLVLAGASGAASGATAVSATVTATGQPPMQGGQGVVFGWTFEVTGSSSIFVTHLGVYDEGGNGLATPHEVGIWYGNTLKTSVTVPAGAVGTCVAGYRYVLVFPPIELTPNPIPPGPAYTIGVLLSPDNTDKFIMAASDVVFDGGQTIKPWWSINYPGCYSREIASSTLLRPLYVTGDPKGLNANFQYTTGAPPTNQPPVAVDDSALTQVGASATVDVLFNDSDPDGDPLSIASFTQGAQGAVTSAEGGLTYTPNPDASGTDSFTYTIGDGQEHTATATVTITINRPPTAAPDAAQTEVGQPVTIAVLENDRDEDGDALAVTGVGAAANGSAALNGDGTVTYTPNTGFTGQDEFSYTLSDGRGGTTTATVFVAVNPKTVSIDIKPGSYPNSINLGSNGVVPVAILSAADFDATTVDPATVSLAGARVAVKGKANRYMVSTQDVNGDGRPDLLLHVETENLDANQLQDGHATIVGKTRAGTPIIGTDEITLVPAN